MRSNSRFTQIRQCYDKKGDNKCDRNSTGYGVNLHMFYIVFSANYVTVNHVFGVMAIAWIL